MIRNRRLVSGVFACFAVACLPCFALPASAQDAGLDVLLEELDALNAAKASQAKELKALKAQVRQIEERLKKNGRGADDGAQEMDRRLKAVEAELATANARVAELESQRSQAPRKGPTLVPSVEFRMRTVGETNRFDLDGRRGGDRDLYFQHRFRAGLTMQLRPDVQVVATLQDAREWAEERSSVSDEHAMDLFEAYLLLRDVGGSGLDIQAGRMRLAYGANRQVSARESNAVGQVFDGLRLSYRMPKVIQADVFATLVRTGIAPVFQPGRGQSPYSVFSGLYLRTDALSFMDIEAYALYLDDGFNDAVEKLGTAGVRLVARPVAGLSLEAEGALQFGRVEGRDLAADTVRASHLAAAVHASGAYRFAVRTHPALGVFFNFATGDANPFNDNSSAYRPTFQSRHNVFGLLDLFTWQGVWDIGPSFSIEPHPDLTLRLNYHALSLSSNGGFVKAFGTESAWRGDGAPVGQTYRHVSFPAGGSRFLGHELDLIVGWQATPWLRVGLEYGFFVPGERTTRAQVLSVTQVTDPGTGVTRNAWQRDGWMGEGWAHRGYLEATVAF